MAPTADTISDRRAHDILKVIAHFMFSVRIRAGFRGGAWGPGPQAPHQQGPPTNAIQVNQLQRTSTKDAAKLAFLSSKIETFSGEGAQPDSPLLDLSPVGRGTHPFPHRIYPPQRVRRLDPRAYGARPRPQGRLPRVLWAPSDAPVTEIDP